MIDLSKLLKEFPRDAISWRAQSVTNDGTKAMALAYIDARDVMNRLDEVCGISGWQCEYPHANGKTICSIGIKCGDEWIWKADGAGDTDIEQEKGAISDAFKRAAVKWGVGRYLYDFKTPWVPCESYKGKDDKWKFSKFAADPWDCLGNSAPSPQAASQAPKAVANPEDLAKYKELVALGKQARGLNEFETKFLNDHNERIMQFGDKALLPSEKQRAILIKIAAKANVAPLDDGIPDYAREGYQH